MERQPSKGILKPTDNSRDQAEHIQWDEDVIAEHDKERGTRMKIDEPKTPYFGPSPAPLLPESEEMLLIPTPNLSEPDRRSSVDLMQGQLPDTAAFMAELNDQLEETEADRKKKDEFEKRRKAHYNEFLVLKQRRSLEMDDEEEQQNSDIDREK